MSKGVHSEGVQEEVLPDQLPILQANPAWDSKKPQYHLSHDGRTELGPFPIKYVKWMIRRRFSPDVLIRAKRRAADCLPELPAGAFQKEA